MYGPPVIGKHVEHAENEDQERSGPFSFEANGNHGTCGETDDRNEDASDGPGALDDESEEKEDKQNTSGEEEANKTKSVRKIVVCSSDVCINLLFLPVGLTNRWNASKCSLPTQHGITEDHEQTTDDTQVPQEETQVKDKTVSEALNDDDGEKTCDGIFGVTFGNDCT